MDIIAFDKIDGGRKAPEPGTIKRERKRQWRALKAFRRVLLPEEALHGRRPAAAIKHTPDTDGR